MVRVREARRAFREFHAQCFWYLRPDLQVSLDDVPRDRARAAPERWTERVPGRGPAMPLSAIQTDVLRLIAENRSPDSYVAGATVLHRTEDTPRYSADLDLFHDLEDSIARSAETDAETLGTAGYELSWLLRTPTFHRAVVRAEERAMKIEWAQDSAFRFYPVQEDERFGYRLHDADAATNKVLAPGGTKRDP